MEMDKGKEKDPLKKKVDWLEKVIRTQDKTQRMLSYAALGNALTLVLLTLNLLVFVFR